MEISLYLSIARRWAWMLILGLVLGVVCGYVVAKLQTPVYQASTRVIASRASMQAASNAGSSSFGEGFYYISDQQLMQTYIELLKSSSIFDKASQALGYPVSSGQVQASQVNDTRILNISVEDTDPQRAADIANAVVEALILQNEEIEASRYNASDESLQIQIKQVEDQIASFQTTLDNQASITLSEQLAQVKAQMVPLETEATQLKKDIAILTPAFTSEQKSKVAELNARLDQIQPLLDLYQKIYADLVVVGASGSTQNDNAITTRLQSTLVLYQQIYLNLINTREAIRLSRLQNSQSIDQIQVAVEPGSPIRPQPFSSAMLAGVVGLMIAAGIVFLIEYLDDTLKVPEDVDRVLGIPLIGYIAEMETVGNAETEVHVSRQPRSPASEAFRSLRTNLEFAAVDKPLRIILVTGAEAGDGKTTVAANLAAIFALGGKRVLLLDCDLRRPRVHRFLGLQNRVGMTDLFRDSLDADSVTQQWMNSNSTSVSVITSGSLPPNPAELLGSQKMDRILEDLAGRADVIVIDSPPSMVSDAQVLAGKVDGVLLVLQPGKTHIGAARALREQLDRAGAHVVGAVFNRITRQSGYYYGGYRYYSPYYSENNKYLTNDDIDPEVESATSFVASKTPAWSSLGNLIKRKK
ncbi:MAG TPA: polysaccharide biosynthesis tyrosine autokinase [Anaerolineales bacterium]|nr:polysaccharide biosynthesis tyrosine autokinase [Anaerolineales bacterium]